MSPTALSFSTLGQENGVSPKGLLLQPSSWDDRTREAEARLLVIQTGNK